MKHMKNTTRSLTILNFLKHLKNAIPLNFITQLSLLVVLFIVCFVVTTPAQLQAARFMPMVGNTATTRSETIFAFERRAFDLINDERYKAGVKPLEWDANVASAARRHSSNMADSDFFGHEDLQGRSPSDRISLSGIGKRSKLGENIVWVSGYQDPVKHAVECWMRSSEHRQNLLDPKYKESGIGAAIAKDGRVYLTQDFMTRK